MPVGVGIDPTLRSICSHQGVSLCHIYPTQISSKQQHYHVFIVYRHYSAHI